MADAAQRLSDVQLGQVQGGAGNGNGNGNVGNGNGNGNRGDGNGNANYGDNNGNYNSGSNHGNNGIGSNRGNGAGGGVNGLSIAPQSLSAPDGGLGLPGVVPSPILEIPGVSGLQLGPTLPSAIK
ncbi:hypothetical protein [Rhodovastum atsumiense]|uniref:Uncharacterized protein n=1 Tax=Rhodovastum atsumiense TaxID=504468 RepID=A0A5M6INQ7_9PROT|nr:hypothetical protein [Rhodovastum atsumiense]KAA5609894.1 hypothetical protein F1189_22170 [Rhodovastum atsumiense]